MFKYKVTIIPRKYVIKEEVEAENGEEAIDKVADLNGYEPNSKNIYKSKAEPVKEN